MAAGESSYGDNDALGFNTAYVRLQDNTNPSGNGQGFLRWIAEESSTSPTDVKFQPIVRVNLATPMTGDDVIAIDWEAQVI